LTGDWPPGFSWHGQKYCYSHRWPQSKTKAKGEILEAAGTNNREGLGVPLGGLLGAGTGALIEALTGSGEKKVLIYDGGTRK